MALADVAVPYCSFHWDIHHPFTPLRLLMARFYHGAPNLTQWNVMIEPLKRRINWWTFAFHLEIERNFDGRRAITASSIQVGIFLNNNCIVEKEVANFSFRHRNFFTYSFRWNAVANVLQDQELLVVKIKLDFPKNVVEERYSINDVSSLSLDLDRLFHDPVHSNMELRSSTGSRFQVHSYIVNARWNNFFNLHPPTADMQTDVQISDGVLKDILVYLYSGVARFGLPREENANYITEMFVLINRYGLYRLYKDMLKIDMQQRRVSEKDVSTVTCFFSLRELVSDTIVANSPTWCVNPNTSYECIFRLRVQTYSGPWLSYSLRSNSDSRFYVQVNLDLRKSIEETRGTVAHTYNQITHVHQRDYTIDPKGFEQSGNVLFLGCPETFGIFELVNRPSHCIEVSDSILCTLTFTDGIIIDQIESTVDDLDAEADRLEKLDILADDLFRLYCSQIGADLRIIAPSEDENEPDEIYSIHKAIFAARVPHWWEVFQDVQNGDDMPTEARLILRSEAFPFVFRYIYSTRSWYVSHDLFEDIQHFANEGGSRPLFERIISIRNEQVADGSDSE